MFEYAQEDNEFNVISIASTSNGVKITLDDDSSDLEQNIILNKDQAISFSLQMEAIANKSDKELEVMDIDWSKAPEGYDFYMPDSGGWFESFFKVVDRTGVSEYRILKGTFHTQRYPECTLVLEGAIKRPVTKPQPKPAFTQEMCDNGELPSVGMEFIYCDSTNTKNNAVVTYVSEWNVVFKCLDDGFSKDVELAKEISGLNIARQILPITPPIELIDGKAYQFDFGKKKELIGIYESKGGEFMERIAMYSATSKFCTNIQPLTVEVK